MTHPPAKYADHSDEEQYQRESARLIACVEYERGAIETPISAYTKQLRVRCGGKRVQEGVDHKPRSASGPINWHMWMIAESLPNNLHGLLSATLAQCLDHATPLVTWASQP
jgi:hypothetical protein